MSVKDRLELARQQVVYNWPYYGPRIVGAALVLLILVLGFLFWKGSRGKPQVTEDINKLALATTPTPAPIGGTTEPTSTVTIVETTPTPTPTEQSQPTETVGSTTTKGGVKTDKLPETGFPLFFVLPAFLAALAGGLKLSRFRKN